jgi:hypothetical protein
MSVKRYDFGPVQPEHYERGEGDFVHHIDYATLELEVWKYKNLYGDQVLECVRLASELKHMTESRNDWRDIAQRKESALKG